MSPDPAGARTEAPVDAAAAVRLRVSDLEVGLRHSGADIVSEASFSVAAGEVLGLVGESGSGKTTIGLALLGHARRGVEIRGGRVELDGVDLLELSPSRLREVRGARVSYVPQDPSSALSPARRIGSQLHEMLKVHPGAVADPEQRISEVLREVRLSDDPAFLHRYPHQLSGGEQQRVGLAMAFICRPSLIVLDEPTTGLDVTTQRHVLETIRSLCGSYGVAAVYVSHDLAVVSGLVSEVAVLYAGRIIELGATASVFGSPLHPYTRGLLAAVPSPERAHVLVGIEGQPPRPGRRPVGCSFANRCPLATDQCRQAPPPPSERAGRLVRCYRAGEGEREPSTPVSAIANLAEGSAEVLAVRGLDAAYGDVTVLSDLTLGVGEERCLAVIGESGSGKTTLARCIVGMHSNWTGTISYRGAELAHSARDRDLETLRRIQYVFQNPYTSLNPRKTVGQILAQPLRHYFDLAAAEREARIARVLEETSLGPEFAPRYPDELSGGERQRVAIARALIVEPDVLVCDEVTSALDVSVQAAIVELLRRLQRERRLAMIFVTHNLALVRGIAQGAVVFREGRIVDAGRVDDVLEHPRDPYTIRLMADVPRLEAVG
ncbi:MAG: ABC transporter ATP-binding protein [Actinobacteria bacterium]|nr:ABC transporter ATP-binding protein [Actinomycetota bacterium]